MQTGAFPLPPEGERWRREAATEWGKPFAKREAAEKRRQLGQRKNSNKK
ncbi:hypothetical protein X769_32320 [Mesorhizobium sp. LSJC268A00]|nr:hypothetical protein X769_32320 [Mesorhizobium sp. LSJC268A00]